VAGSAAWWKNSLSPARYNDTGELPTHISLDLGALIDLRPLPPPSRCHKYHPFTLHFAGSEPV